MVKFPWRGIWQYLTKLHIHSPFYPAVTLLRIYPEVIPQAICIHICVYVYIHVYMFIAAIFVIAKH